MIDPARRNFIWEWSRKRILAVLRAQESLEEEQRRVRAMLDAEMARRTPPGGTA